MSLTRRLAAVLPAAGVTAVAALALTGAPAVATGDGPAARAQQPAVMTTPCAEGERDEDCGYGDDDATGGGTRGNDGYGGESPTASPSPSRTTVSPTPSTPATPTASVDTVPPGGESPVTSPAASPSTTPGGGVSAGGTLPVTGPPMGLTVGAGGLLIAAGAAAVFYTRRRRSA